MIFTGFVVLVGLGLTGGEFDFLTNVSCGPVSSPRISFVGGVAAFAVFSMATIVVMFQILLGAMQLQQWSRSPARSSPCS